MAKLNNILEINNKAHRALQQSSYQEFAFNLAHKRFEDAKSRLMKEFDEDPVNQEIESGPDSDSSQFLNWGNLYSFIGFNAGSNPIGDLRNFIENNVEMKSKADFQSTNTRLTYKFPVQYPSIQDIYEETSMSKYADGYPNSKSFVELVRGAINSTVGNYIFSVLGFGNSSRSGTGLQNKKANNTFNSFIATPDYIIKLFNEFKESFR